MPFVGNTVFLVGHPEIWHWFQTCVLRLKILMKYIFMTMISATSECTDMASNKYLNPSTSLSGINYKILLLFENLEKRILQGVYLRLSIFSIFSRFVFPIEAPLTLSPLCWFFIASPLPTHTWGLRPFPSEKLINSFHILRVSNSFKGLFWTPCLFWS